MDMILELVIDRLAMWIAKSKRLNVWTKSTLVFIVLNILTVPLLWLTLTMAPDILVIILGIVVCALWFAITVFCVIRGHRRKWKLE